MKRILLLLLVVPFLVFSQQTETKTPITTTELAPGIYKLFVNNAVTVVVWIGNDGILLIDTGYERTANDLLSEVKSLSSAAIKYIINTHIHGDHTGGNQLLGKGVDIIAHKNVKEFLSTERTQGEKVIPPFPEYAQPNIIVTDKMNHTFNGETIEITHLPNGHTNGDIIIFFPKSNVLAVGDLLFANYFPYVDTGNGGNPFRYIENIEWITKSFPANAKIVGGHGPVYSMEEYANWGKTLQKTIDVIKDQKINGLTPEQMKENRILNEWESFGKFFITEERWIDTIYPFL
jgi:glyoxylase-like metal-dependent hydrolase (beta-lactamase superfamily II)